LLHGWLDFGGAFRLDAMAAQNKKATHVMDTINWEVLGKTQRSIKAT
jgi:hypothetical protein